MKYSFLKSLLKAVKYPLLIMLGLLIAGFISEYPDYANMSVGALLILIYDFLKHKLNVQLP